jgi:hypothetical protein
LPPCYAKSRETMFARCLFALALWPTLSSAQTVTAAHQASCLTACNSIPSKTAAKVGGFTDSTYTAYIANTPGKVQTQAATSCTRACTSVQFANSCYLCSWNWMSSYRVNSDPGCTIASCPKSTITTTWSGMDLVCVKWCNVVSFLAMVPL